MKMWFSDSAIWTLSNRWRRSYIEAGSFIGIAGLSGSGKSTLMKLMPRLYNIEKGSISIDGKY